MQIDYSIKKGDVVYSETWQLTELVVVDVNWALKAVALRLGAEGTIVVWPVSGVTKAPQPHTPKTTRQLTTEQAIVLTGFTGVSHCNFGDFHEDVEKRLGHPVWTHQFASKEFSAELREVYRDDFLAMMPADTPKGPK